MGRRLAVLLGGVASLVLAGCASDRAVYAYPPIRAEAMLRLPALSREALTDEVLSAILARHAQSVPDAVEAWFEDGAAEGAVAADTTEKGLIRVRLDGAAFARLLAGEGRVRLCCRREGQWYERAIDLQAMLARGDLPEDERAVLATCDSLFVVGGWRKIEKP
ncbi:MAG: hypothetical protein JXQ29_16655 [Planctomycetes bacterium]|nr:hypothetical protein [Planctomycetota bacterium]